MFWKIIFKLQYGPNYKWDVCQSILLFIYKHGNWQTFFTCLYIEIKIKISNVTITKCGCNSVDQRIRCFFTSDFVNAWVMDCSLNLVCIFFYTACYIRQKGISNFPGLWWSKSEVKETNWKSSTWVWSNNGLMWANLGVYPIFSFPVLQ